MPGWRNGIRDSLKNYWSQGLVSSSLTLGTLRQAQCKHFGCVNAITVSTMSKTIKELQFKVLIEQDEDGIYVASVPELPGAYTQGKTLKEVRERIKEVIELVLESEPHSSPNFFRIEEVTIQSYA